MSPAPDPEGLYASPDAIAFHRDQIVFDGLSLQYILGDTYIERHLEGGITATNLTVATENQDWDQVLRTVDSSLDRVARHPDLTLATCVADIRAAKRDGRIAVVLGTQGSDFVGSQLWRVDILHRLGVRFVGLAYTGATLFGDGCGELRDAGLTFLGRDFIERVNGLPILLDLSHSGHQTRAEAVELALHPVCTHSNSFSVHANSRNTKDEVVTQIAAKGGVVGLCGMPRSVANEDPTLQDMLRHLRHYVDLVGTEHVGIGLDFTEGYQDEYRAGKVIPQTHAWRTRRPDIFGSRDDFFTQPYPRGLHGIRLLPNLTHELLGAAYTPDQIADILGGSWMRTFENVVG